jgi:hypothetical protein
MEIVVIHDEQKLSTNLDFLKTRLNGTYQVVSLTQFEREFPKMNPDLVIFFHSLGLFEHHQLKILKE